MQNQHTSAPFLDYEPPPHDRMNPQLLQRLRIGLFVCMFAGGTYAAVLFRGWEVGSMLPATFILTSLFAGLPACVVFLGVRWRYHLAIVATLVVVPALLADGYGTFEEAMFVSTARKLPATTPTVFRARWWPNGHCYMYFDPATGELGGGD